jgi:hypothetical protein
MKFFQKPQKHNDIIGGSRVIERLFQAFYIILAEFVQLFQELEK